jgi:DNA-binding NarL/FixJ family response regulator
MIKIIIIDNHESERNHTQAVLDSQTDCQIVGLGKDCYDALILGQTLKPDIAIFDIGIEHDSIEIIPLLKCRSPETAVFLLTALADEDHICKAIYHEVQGYMLKGTDAETLVSAIRHVYEGGQYISPIIRDKTYQICSQLIKNRERVSRGGMELRVKKEWGKGIDSSIFEKLSKKELEIMACIGQGYTTEETAARFQLARGTVRNYLSSGMKKAGLQHRTQIPLFAIEQGLIKVRGS